MNRTTVENIAFLAARLALKRSGREEEMTPAEAIAVVDAVVADVVAIACQAMPPAGIGAL